VAVGCELWRQRIFLRLGGGDAEHVSLSLLASVSVSVVCCVCCFFFFFFFEGGCLDVQTIMENDTTR
jgi:hypothetical protein